MLSRWRKRVPRVLSRRMSIKQVFQILKHRMQQISRGEHRVIRINSPINPKCRIVQRNARSCRANNNCSPCTTLRVGLEGDKSMGESNGNKKLRPILGRENDTDVFAQRRGTAADINNDIQNFPCTTRSNLSWAIGAS